jgi:hypothetical protein
VLGGGGDVYRLVSARLNAAAVPRVGDDARCIQGLVAACGDGPLVIVRFALAGGAGYVNG